MNLHKIIENANRIAIAGHVKPDGDCTGSCLGLYNFINEYYHKEVHLFLEPIPRIFHFLQSADTVEDASIYEGESFDVFFALDCGDLARLGAAGKLFESAKKSICVDHHISNLAFADENYIFPHASSTCELIYDLVEYQPITREIAECLYVGIVHDTGVFQYSSTSSKTMNIAGKLMDTGIEYTKIIDDTFYSKTYEQNRALGKALLNSELLLEGKLILSNISGEELQLFGADTQDLDGIVSQLRLTKYTEVAVFLYETEDGCQKVSMRSNGLVNVASITGSVGGGGHIRAAGATVKGSYEQVKQLIIDKIQEQTGW